MAMDFEGAGDGRRNAIALLLRSMADDEFVIGFSDSEWTGIGPILEEDVAISSLAQDELGHARALYELLAEHLDDGRDADELAYDREPEASFHARLLDHGRGDWATTILRRYLYDTADDIRLAAVVSSSYRPLADLVAKLRREERYHLMHVEAWLDRLARGGDESRRRLVDAIADLGPDATSVLTPLPGERALLAHGVIASPFAELEAAYLDRVGRTFRSLGLPDLPTTNGHDGARTDHSDAFRALHAEFTMVRRSEVGATW
jgi:ring-1,2-phenylacetyl-CoA epoxidase subunit PaaC